MANIMSLKNVRNKASRNGFDLSRRTCFTAKVGELLPVWWQYVLPGDSFNIDLQSFTRTQPVNTASFGRIREYYDFFFVPLDQLWNKSSTVLTQMLDNTQHATSLSGTSNLDGSLPCFTNLNSFNYTLQKLNESDYKDNVFGFNRRLLSLKLLSYLGYGQINAQGDGMQALDPVTGYAPPQLSIYPLLAYQKIYSDFFRFTQWETANPSTFNVDWMTGSGDTVLSSNSFTDFSGDTMLDLRYCNYQKDLFHGIMPNAQFGSTAAAPISLASLNTSSYRFSDSDGVAAGQDLVLTGGTLAGSGKSFTRLQINDASAVSSLSILALRQAEALQRWKEVAQAAEEDYKQQIQAHWNVNVSDLLSGQCRYLGGTNGNVSINEVVNTNLVSADGAQPADLAGKGIGNQNGKISFNSQGEYGVIMCIYHALPIIDYITSGTDAKLLHVNGSSFPIPEMDSIGMELLPSVSLTNIYPFGNKPTDFLGFVPRYIDFKTDYDRCIGGFASLTAKNLQTWIIPLSDSNVSPFLSATAPGSQPEGSNPNVANNQPSYLFTKVDPHIVDVMFSAQVDSSLDTDHLLCQSFFQCYVTRNLDVNGLPY